MRLFALVSCWSERCFSTIECRSLEIKHVCIATEQDHYDFGMRALKSVLVMAGAAKRAAVDWEAEESVVISAIRNANLPKLTSEVGWPCV
jgi:hypothetical protein